MFSPRRFNSGHPVPVWVCDITYRHVRAPPRQFLGRCPADVSRPAAHNGRFPVQTHSKTSPVV